MISKKHKKVSAISNYTVLYYYILVCAITAHASISISASACLVGIAMGIKCYVVPVEMRILTAVIKSIIQEVRKRESIDNKV